jgi:hypothetical protein
MCMHKPELTRESYPSPSVGIIQVLCEVWSETVQNEVMFSHGGFVVRALGGR